MASGFAFGAISARAIVSAWTRAALCLAIFACSIANGATDNYTNGAGTFSWSNGANWSGGAVPATNDVVTLTAGGGSPTFVGWTVAYDYTGAAVTLSSLTISHSGGVLHGTDFITIGDGATPLSAASEFLGNSGSKGFGGVTQSGSTNTVTGVLDLGVLATDIGTYTLSGDGNLSVSGGTLNVGMAGSGTFNQNGGTAGISNLNVGGATGAGTFDLTAGSLSPGFQEQIGTSGGTGTFIQSGGTNDAPSQNLIIGTNGSYSLSGTGILNGNTETLAGGFTHSAGTHTIGSAVAGSGYFLHVTSGTYTLSQTGVLTIHGEEKIGVNSGDVGTFIQNGGQHTVDFGNITIGDAAGSKGSYNLNSGTLGTVGSEIIGNSGTGTFTQTGGSNSVGDLTIGTGSSYTLGPGSLSVSGNDDINGTFTQNGGSHSATGAGSGSGGGGLLATTITGGYTLGSGTFSAGLEIIEGGTFNQTGGVHTVGTPGVHQLLAIIGNGSAPPVTGSYSLSAGATLTVNGSLHVGGVTLSSSTQTISQAIPTGVLNVNGGTLTVTDLINLWTGTGTAINFSAGSISTPLLVGDATEFNWTGGTLNITGPAGLTIGSGAFFQNLSITNGLTLTAAALTITNGGTFTPNNGGATSIAGPITLTGGTLKSGVSAFTNTGQISGFGAIAGTTGFANAGSISIPTGVLNMSNSGALSSSGSITLSPGTQLQLTGGNLANTGSINLDGGTISGPATLNNNAGGLITGLGTIAVPLANNAGGNLLVPTGTEHLAQPATNAGAITLSGPASVLAGSAITNNGLIHGAGQLNDPLTNTASAEIRAEQDQWLIIAAMTAANAGKINLQGGTVEFTSALTNQGTVTGHGTLLADTGFTNNGQVQLAGGFSSVYGNVTSSSGSKIVVAGGTTSTFYNNVTLQSGSTFQVSLDAIAVFLGNVTGAANFTGSGTKDFEAGASNVGAVNTQVGSTLVQTPAAVTADFFKENALTIDGHVSITHKALNDDANSASTLTTLAVDPGGTIDLSNNQMLAGIPQATTRADLHSHAITTTATGGTLGYADQGSGVTKIEFTLGGDANLDLKVDVGDLGALATNYGKTSGAFWNQGDFTYDGAVDVGDLGALATSYGQTLAAGSADAAPAADIATASTAVPEPAVAMCVFIPAGAALRRRRREIKIS